jgi:hypothetical protein
MYAAKVQKIFHPTKFQSYGIRSSQNKELQISKLDIGKHQTLYQFSKMLIR